MKNYPAHFILGGETMSEIYKLWLVIWNYINDLNSADIYIYGEAITDEQGRQKIAFESTLQVNAYNALEKSYYTA